MQYKPIEIEFKQNLGVISKEEAKKFENKKTRELMKVHGLNNVRGGDLSQNISHSKTEDFAVFFGSIYMKKDIDSLAAMLVLILLMIMMFFFGRISA